MSEEFKNALELQGKAIETNQKNNEAKFASKEELQAKTAAIAVLESKNADLEAKNVALAEKFEKFELDSKRKNFDAGSEDESIYLEAKSHIRDLMRDPNSQEAKSKLIRPAKQGNQYYY